MRILVVGASGTIGRAVADALSSRHEVIRASSKSSPTKVDISNPNSIRGMYRSLGRVDHVVCCAGSAKFGPLQDSSDDDFRYCLDNKVVGQAPWVTETLIAYKVDPTHGVPAAHVAKTYVKAVEGEDSGQTLAAKP